MSSTTTSYRLLGAALGLVSMVSVGCGAYHDGYYYEEVSVTETTTVSAGSAQTVTVAAVAPAPAVTAPAATTQVVVYQPTNQTPIVVVPHQAPVAAPAPAPMPAPAPAVIQVAAAQPAAPAMQVDADVVCSGNQRLHVTGRHVGADGTTAVYATGNCELLISESHVRGTVIATGNAQVTLLESRIWGDLVSHGNAQVMTQGSRHHEGHTVAN